LKQSAVDSAHGTIGQGSVSSSGPAARFDYQNVEAHSAAGSPTTDPASRSTTTGRPAQWDDRLPGNGLGGGAQAALGPSRTALADETRAASAAAVGPTDPMRSDTTAYVVQPGDSYWDISRRLFGVGDYFEAIYEHNRARYPRPDALQVGDRLVIPSAEVLHQRYPELCPPPRGEATGPVARAARTPPPGCRIYTVQEGDNLFSIARYALGRAARWAEIYDLNRELLGNSFHDVRPGLQLVLPAADPPASQGDVDAHLSRQGAATPR
jgi:nucleoid-associated protein YgaU